MILAMMATARLVMKVRTREATTTLQNPTEVMAMMMTTILPASTEVMAMMMMMILPEVTTTLQKPTEVMAMMTTMILPASTEATTTLQMSTEMMATTMISQTVTTTILQAWTEGTIPTVTRVMTPLVLTGTTMAMMGTTPQMLAMETTLIPAIQIPTEVLLVKQEVAIVPVLGLTTAEGIPTAMEALQIPLPTVPPQQRLAPTLEAQDSTKSISTQP
jgi:hypothetical protein